MISIITTHRVIHLNPELPSDRTLLAGKPSLWPWASQRFFLPDICLSGIKIWRNCCRQTAWRLPTKSWQRSGHILPKLTPTSPNVVVFFYRRFMDIVPLAIEYEVMHRDAFCTRVFCVTDRMDFRSRKIRSQIHELLRNGVPAAHLTVL